MTGPDFRLQDHGSIWLLVPCSEAAQVCVDENLSHAQKWGPGSSFGTRVTNWCVIEPRYVPDIVAGFQEEGLTV